MCFIFCAVLGETNEAFYQNIYTGQRLPSLARPPRPPRPPPPAALRSISYPSVQHHNNNNSFNYNQNNQSNQQQQQQQPHQQQYQHHNHIIHNNNDDDDDNSNADGPPWICSMCTFHNHPLLNKCEECDMPRISSGTVQVTASQFKPRLQHMQFLRSAPPNPTNSVQSAPAYEISPFQYNNNILNSPQNNGNNTSSSNSSNSNEFMYSSTNA